jgi:hypothetical protein
MRPTKMARAVAWYRLHGRDDPADALEAELARAGRCRRCGRALTDPASSAASAPNAGSGLHERYG